MKEFLKNTYGFTNYQVAQLEFLGKTLLSEISKLIIMGFFFYDRLEIYLAAILMLLLLRTSTGGFHCKTYLSCLLVSFLYMVVCIRILPLIPINKFLGILMLLACLLINYRIGPVTSAIHMPLSEKNKQKGRLRALVIIVSFIFISCIIPEQKLFTVCFWVIIVHSLQLIYAKIQKKGEAL